MLSLVVENCRAAEVSENISSSTQDRSKCEAVQTAPGEEFMLNVNTPLHLGGRSSVGGPANYPAGLTAQGFNGCVKNFVHNGIVSF